MVDCDSSVCGYLATFYVTAKIFILITGDKLLLFFLPARVRIIVQDMKTDGVK